MDHDHEMSMPRIKSLAGEKSTNLTERDSSQSQRSLEQVLRLAKIGVWEVNYATMELTWSGATREITEVSPDYQPTVESVLQFYLEPSRSQIVQQVEQARETGHGFEVDSEVMTASGKRKWIHTVGEPEMSNGVCTRMVGYFFDITDKMNLLSERRKSELRLSQIIEKSSDAILLLDAEGLITYCSPAIYDMLGYKPAEVIRTPMLNYLFMDDVANVAGQFGQMKTTRKSVSLFVRRLRHRSGEPVHVEGSARNLLHDENLKSIVLSLRNVTELVAAERSLRAKTRKLERVAAFVSHQVRGPVASIMGLVALFNHAKPDDPVNEEIVSKIMIPVSRLDQIITEIVGLIYELDLQTEPGTEWSDKRTFSKEKEVL